MPYTDMPLATTTCPGAPPGSHTNSNTGDTQNEQTNRLAALRPRSGTLYGAHRYFC